MENNVFTRKSLADLKLSDATRKHVESFSLNVHDWVAIGRIAAFKSEACPDEILPAWKLELVEALREAGLLRPSKEIAVYLGVRKLYNRLFDWNFPDEIEDLSAGQYEEFEPISEEIVESITEVLSSVLDMRRINIIYSRFGIRDGVIRSTNVIGEMFSTSTNIESVISHALRRLCYVKYSLPVVFRSRELDKDIIQLGKKLIELRADLIFKREREMSERLESLKKIPFKHEMTEFFPVYYRETLITSESSIDCLDLPDRASRRLARCGIDTVGKLVNLSLDEYNDIVRGPYEREEALCALHSIGLALYGEIFG